LLQRHQEQLDALAQWLLEKEVLYRKDLETLLEKEAITLNSKF